MMPLDRNESYWLLDDELLVATRVCDRRELSMYPDPNYTELKQALAAYVGVPPEQVLVTPGSASAIEHIVRLFASDGGVVALPVPTFYGYETILGYVGSNVMPIAYTEHQGRFVFPLKEVITMLKSNTANVLFLCHPNNPLGCPLTSEDISALVEAARESDTIVVSDEAYIEFSSGISFLPHLATLSNLIVIRSLSKAFALSGARVGYAITDSSIVKKLERILIQWPIAHSSVAVARALLARAEQVRVRRDIVIGAREQFARALSRLPNVTVYPSATNFILMRVPNASRVREKLLAKGIHVALGESMSSFSNARALLHDTLRIVVPAPESEELFMTMLRKSLE